MSEFKITGPGEYKTRKGEKATLVNRVDGHFGWNWNGWTYSQDGNVFSGREHLDDIVGYWLHEPMITGSCATGITNLTGNITSSVLGVPLRVSEYIPTGSAFIANNTGTYGSSMGISAPSISELIMKMQAAAVDKKDSPWVRGADWAFDSDEPERKFSMDKKLLIE